MSLVPWLVIQTRVFSTIISNLLEVEGRGKKSSPLELLYVTFVSFIDAKVGIWSRLNANL